MKRIQLKKGKEIALSRKHPWIFSGALFKPDPTLVDGEHVHVCNANDRILATGHYSKASIAVRILAFSERTLDKDFYLKKITQAKSIRSSILNLPSSETNCYRLIAGEGDELSGLIIDIYDANAVIQCHTNGMLNDIELISQALDECMEKQLNTIFLKSIHIKDSKYDSRFLKGDQNETIVKENGHSFHVNWMEGQKTGFFLDQRENRELLGKMSTGRKVLNTFCYTGGFSVYALENNADSVTSIDISQTAMDQTVKNVELNSTKINNHKAITGNVMQFLQEVKQDEYDLIILDPPAFAKNRNKSHNAVQAYKRLNLAAMKKIKAGGIVFSFSCSQVVDRNLFENTIRAAGIESGRDVKILKHLSQAPDHLINLFHQEGHYLKGLIFTVD